MTAKLPKNTSKNPDIIYGTEMVRALEQTEGYWLRRVDIVQQFKDCQCKIVLHICKLYGDGCQENIATAYDPTVTSSFPPFARIEYRILASCLDLKEAIAAALLKERACLEDGWLIHNRQPALGEAGLDCMAREVLGVARLLIGPTRPPHGSWGMTPTRNADWQEKMERMKLKLYSRPSQK